MNSSKKLQQLYTKDEIQKMVLTNLSELKPINLSTNGTKYSRSEICGRQLKSQKQISARSYHFSNFHNKIFVIKIFIKLFFLIYRATLKLFFIYSKQFQHIDFYKVCFSNNY